MTINRFQIDPTPQRNFYAHYFLGGGISSSNNYVIGGSVSGTTLTLTRRGLDPVMITDLPNPNEISSDFVRSNHIPANVNGELHESGLQIGRPQLLSTTNEQWHLYSSDTFERYQIVFTPGLYDAGRVISLDSPSSLAPGDSANQNYIFNDATDINRVADGCLLIHI